MNIVTFISNKYPELDSKYIRRFVNMGLVKLNGTPLTIESEIQPEHKGVIRFVNQEIEL